MLIIENVSIQFGEEILFSELNFQLNKGELVCITGESGKGKTSLLKAIMGFIPVKNGRIVVDKIELNIRNVDSVRRKISWMPQELALPSEWVYEMIRMPFELKANKNICFAKDCLMFYFDKLGLDHELYNKRVGEISGGQRQRIMLAVSAMLGRPLLMVDEPTSALDPGSCDKVLDFFHTLNQSGMSILAVSHDAKFMDGCNRRLML